MSTTNSEKDSLSGQRVLPPEQKPSFGKTGFLLTPYTVAACLARVCVGTTKKHGLSEKTG